MSRRFMGLLVLMVMLSVALAACGDNTAAPAPTAVPAAASSSGSAPTVAAGSGSPTTTSIAPYSGLTATSGPDLFSQSFESTVRKGAASNITGFQFSYFTTSDSGDKVFAYYDDAAPQAGYTKQGSQNQAMPVGSSSVNVIYHAYLQKNSASSGQIYEVAAFGPLDATTAQSMSTGNTTTYNAGDSVVVIVQCMVAGS